MNRSQKAAWHTTISHYRAWNEAESRRNIRNAGQKSLLQKWREFLAMMEFGVMLKPKPSRHEQQQKMAMLHRYYDRIQRFEARRVAHGQSV